MHANGKDTTGHLEVAFKFHPQGYKPKFDERLMPIGTGDIDIRRAGAGAEGRSVHDAEPADQGHGVRAAHACRSGADVFRRDLRVPDGDSELFRLRPQLGACLPVQDDAAPLLPRGTILRVTGYYDNTPANRNVADPRNWSGLGHRSIDNMNISIMQGFSLTDEQFQAEMTARREFLKLKPGRRCAGLPLMLVRQAAGRRRARRRRDSQP